MPTLWDAFLEDYDQEIWDWSLRQTLEAFWHYCQNGNLAVMKWQEENGSRNNEK